MSKEQRQLMTETSGQGNLEGSFLADPKKKALIEKWQKWIPQKNGRALSRYDQWVVAQLFENQLGDLKSFKEKHMLSEDTSTANTAPFVKYTFPLLRRVWPSLIAPEIVSVQPMTAPVGGIFYFELKYGTTKGKVTAGDKLVKDFNRYYSSQLIDGEAFTTGVTSGTDIAGTLDYTPVLPGTVKITHSSVSGEIVDDGSGALTGTGGLALSGGTINYTTGAIAGTLGGAVLRSGLSAVYQYNMEGNSLIPQVDVDIDLLEIRARTRKLKALWSSEASDDLKALHGVDAEQELVAGIGSELALEIDREIIEDIRVGASGPSTTFDLSTPSGIEEVKHLRGMLTPLAKLSNRIGVNTLRGPANFLVMSYDAASFVEQLGTDGFFRPVFAGNVDAMAPAEAPQTWGVMKFGTLQQRWHCYKDPYMTASEVIVGYKGSSFVDAGYVWAPYVALQSTNTFLDPNDFKYRKGLSTRYAKALVRGEFYGKLNLLNVNALGGGSFGNVSLNF